MRKLVRILIWTLLVCAVLAGGMYALFDPWMVPGDDAQFAVSIEPTLSAGDIVLVSRMASPADGNLARCSDPDSPGRYVVGRVIGSGTDMVEFANGGMTINGKRPNSAFACDAVHLKNPATQEDMELGCSMEEFAGTTHPALVGKAADRDSKAQLEPGKLFLVSDDRVLHLDSRDFGQVSAISCHTIVARLWGLSGWGDAKRRLTILW
ncbi:MAG TPA: signal peptidase I [Polyangiaceae bacterium]|nr:signal peptidase I [Polyangiaceae bacterium]